MQGMHLGERVPSDVEELLCCTGMGLAAATASTSGPASASQDQRLPHTCSKMALPTNAACQKHLVDGGGAQAHSALGGEQHPPGGTGWLLAAPLQPNRQGAGSADMAFTSNREAAGCVAVSASLSQVTNCSRSACGASVVSSRCFSDGSSCAPTAGMYMHVHGALGRMGRLYGRAERKLFSLSPSLQPQFGDAAHNAPHRNEVLRDVVALLVEPAPTVHAPAVPECSAASAQAADDEGVALAAAGDACTQPAAPMCGAGSSMPLSEAGGAGGSENQARAEGAVGETEPADAGSLGRSMERGPQSGLVPSLGAELIAALSEGFTISTDAAAEPWPAEQAESGTYLEHLQKQSYIKDEGGLVKYGEVRPPGMRAQYKLSSCASMQGCCFVGSRCLAAESPRLGSSASAICLAIVTLLVQACGLPMQLTMDAGALYLAIAGVVHAGTPVVPFLTNPKLLSSMGLLKKGRAAASTMQVSRAGPEQNCRAFKKPRLTGHGLLGFGAD